MNCTGGFVGRLFTFQHCKSSLQPFKKNRAQYNTGGAKTYNLVVGGVSGKDMHGLHVSMTDGEVFAEAGKCDEILCEAM